jgi:hypothetical protein
MKQAAVDEAVIRLDIARCVGQMLFPMRQPLSHSGRSSWSVPVASLTEGEPGRQSPARHGG